MAQSQGYLEMKVQGDPEDASSTPSTAASTDSSLMSTPEQPNYFQKMAGAGEAPPPRVSPTWSAFSFLGAFTGMAAIGLLHSYVMLPQEHMVLLVGAFGAMSVIVFSAIKAPVAQPFNVIAGNTIGGLVGVFVFEVMQALGLGHMVWLSAALAVSLTIGLQEFTRTVHPPGGATALIYVTTPGVQHMGFWFAFCPSFLGAAIMVAVACATNNLSGERTYPQYWWPSDEEPESREGGDGVESSWIERYLLKLRGAGAKALPAASPPLSQTWCSLLGSFAGIAALALLNDCVVVPQLHGVLLIGAFGAMSVIVFSAWKVPFAQPKNAIVGNTIGGFVGVSVFNCLALAGMGGHIWLGAALSVALTITAQELTNTVHPPGGATALIFEIVPALHKFGYAYVLTPSLLGTVIIVLVGCLTNNLAAGRHYPQFWCPLS